MGSHTRTADDMTTQKIAKAPERRSLAPSAAADSHVHCKLFAPDMCRQPEARKRASVH